uniref:LIM domain only protein 7-like n=1 Tax=Knipowitschia caucasica TaxID=637954 RepID=A0AAV2LR77_KNICA
MEWRQQTSLSCADAFSEAQRWIEEVTGKIFDCRDFRASLENGVLLCDVINKLKPGIIKRVNRLSTPIAGLDNVSVFLKACGKLGLNESQLFHPGDLQDMSSRVTLRWDESRRRLKNVLITIYWLGRKANQDRFYEGPQLHLKSFEGLLGLALSRALGDTAQFHYQDKEIQRTRQSYKRHCSVDSAHSPENKATPTNSEGCSSDAEAEQVFKMETSHISAPSNRSRLPAPLQKAKQARAEKSCTSPSSTLSRSKSLTDIPMVYPVRNSPEETTILDETKDSGTILFKRKSSSMKDTEAQWHEDLNKWKSRRRSSKTEGYSTSQDREHVIHQMTIDAKAAFQKTTAQGPMKREQPDHLCHIPGSHPYSPTSPTKPSRSNHRPHTRAMLTRSYATESPPYCSRMTANIQWPSAGATLETNLTTLDKQMVSLASVGTAVTTPSVDHPFSSQTHARSVTLMSHNMTGENGLHSSALTKENANLNAAADELTSENHADIDTASTTSHSGKQELNMEPINSQHLEALLSRSCTWSGSASLPRGYRRSEGTSRLSSVISAKPFGTKPTRVSSLPKLCHVDDSQMTWLAFDDKEVSPPVTLKNRQMVAHLKGHAPVMQREHSAEQKNCAIQPQPPIQALPQPQFCATYVPEHGSELKESSLPKNVDHSDMRVCLTLRPNSRQDFGFQAHWDSTGARVKSIHPGSPAELCHLRINDEILAVDGVTVKQLNFNQWKNKMTSALQSGTLTMDIRRLGNRGGSESAISDLQVPSLSPSCGSSSWDREEERRRQEKWQEEQERLLQEKYQRDQERLEAEWRKAQQDATSELKMSSENQQMNLHVNGTSNKTHEERRPPTDAGKRAEPGSAPWDAKEMLQEAPRDNWADGSPGFAQLSPAHRAMSMSSPALTTPQKLVRGDSDQRTRKSQSVSTAEQERQQILQEMKKRTQLLTDNSWIRQRSASFYKEPIMPGVPIKRYESMDHLESWRHSPVTAAPHSRPQSAAAGLCGSSRTSSRHSTGSMPPQRSRTEPGPRTCCVCEGLLDSGAAMVIEDLSLNFHLSCFQCLGCSRDLRGAETGVKVRIHNHRPYCEACYVQLKCADTAS